LLHVLYCGRQVVSRLVCIGGVLEAHCHSEHNKSQNERRQYDEPNQILFLRRCSSIQNRPSCHPVSLVPLDHPFLNCEATGVSARLAVEGVVQVRETIKGVSAQTVSNLPTRRIVLVENGTGREPNCRPVNENGRHPLPFLTYTPPMQKFQRHNIL